MVIGTRNAAMGNDILELVDMTFVNDGLLPLICSIILRSTIRFLESKLGVLCLYGFDLSLRVLSCIPLTPAYRLSSLNFSREIGRAHV